MCAALSFTAVGVPAASGLEYEEVPAEVKPAPIVVGRFVRNDSPTSLHAPRTFTFSVLSGFCVGKAKPRIDHVRVTERPKDSDRPFKSTVITAFLLYPPYLRVIPPSTPSPRFIYNACAGIGLTLTKRIKLKRPAAGLFFYDGSYQHPHRVWPPVARASEAFQQGREGLEPSMSRGDGGPGTEANQIGRASRSAGSVRSAVRARGRTRTLRRRCGSSPRWPPSRC